eukprot:GHVP01048125.1.p1 GENE.GHVP01048125.1~~GHVP01048125.1.p1  ORF type:complete len:337 (+),score=41.47 GHVP01048125.1:38-1012(+)
MKLVTPQIFFRTISQKLCLFIRVYIPMLWSILDYFLLAMLSFVRLGAGRWVAKGVDKCQRPAKPLELYEYEGCPYCRKTRETLSVLALDVVVYPCPRESLGFIKIVNSRFRSIAQKAADRMGCKMTFPYLVDPNNGTELFDSGRINEYLWREYGHEATSPLNTKIALSELYFSLTNPFLGLLRPCLDFGFLRAPSRRPQNNLEVYAREDSVDGRRLREMLTTLETPYLLHHMPIGSENERKFQKFAQSLKQSASSPTILLRDPNEKEKCEKWTAGEAIEFMKSRYQTCPIPDETWVDYPMAASWRSWIPLPLGLILFRLKAKSA